MKSRMFMLVGTMILTSGIQDALAFYNASTGRWLSRDAITETGGINLYAFLRNAPIASVDSLGLAVCEKCGVKQVSLQIAGIETKYEGFLFHLIGTPTYKTKADGPRFRGYCCAIRQWAKSRVSLNGISQTTDNNNMPLDGQWHIDQPYWGGPAYDAPEQATQGIGSNRFTTTDSDGDILSVTEYDSPGVSGFTVGDTFSDQTSFLWKIYDRCNNWKLVATSRTVSYDVSGTWPNITYSYTR